ncbi:hypothetical protein ScPMuIL_013391 [Solemya velum]
MTDTMSRRVYNISASVSQAHRDLIDDRYRDLRRPRKVRFFVNGDRYFRGKKLYITPHRYFNFNDLLTDLTGKLPSNLNLPYGVRQIFTPSGGRRVTDIEDLGDGHTYVCAGFEGFRQIKYGKSELEPWSVARPHRHEVDDQNYTTYRTRGAFGTNAFHPGRYFHGSYPHRKWPGTFGTANRNSYLLQQSESVPLKPKVVTVVRNGQRPRNNVKILLNRRSVQSFEQLMQDISQAFGPKWKNNKVRKLFTLRGHDVQSISDFFREDDIFIGVGNDPLTENDVQDIVEEFFRDSSYAKSLVKDLERSRKKRHQLASSKDEHDKRDSGFGEGSDGSNRDPDQEHIIYKGRIKEKGKHRRDYPKEYDLALRLEKEREKAANEERERAQKQQQKMLEAERRAMEDERRKRGLVPLKPVEDPFKKMKEQKEREKEEARKVKEEERRRHLEEEKFRKDQEKNEKAEQAARERQAAMEKEKLDREKEKTDKEKLDKEMEKETESEEKESVVKEVKEIEKEKDDGEKIKEKEKTEHSSQHKMKKRKSRIVRKTKLERQVSSDDFVLKQFDLGRTLGDGNFAIVRQAKFKANSSDYALKIIDKPKLKGKEHMVENEIDIMKDCHHHNIVKLYEEYETADKLYLVMELVKGGDLFDAITQSVKFGEVDSAGMVKDLCSALFYLHSRSIVHRDLKPENLLVHRNKDSSITLKLADFGLAMEVKDLIYTVCGTPTYVAPEILSEIGYGIEVDMWAVGVITYILLCGFPPFRSPDRNQTELFEFIKAGEYEFLSPYWDNISASAKDLIEHLLVVDRKRRYTAIDVLSHPWIICAGDMSNPMDNAKSDERRRTVKKEYEETARRNYEDYQKLKERKARGDFNN